MSDADCTSGREPRSVAASFLFVPSLRLLCIYVCYRCGEIQLKNQRKLKVTVKLQCLWYRTVPVNSLTHEQGRTNHEAEWAELG